MASVILVTGGTGLVGKAIEHIINTEPEGSRFGKKAGETWIFASSSEGDLRFAGLCPVLSRALNCAPQRSSADASVVREVQAHPCYPPRSPG